MPPKPNRLLSPRQGIVDTRMQETIAMSLFLVGIFMVILLLTAAMVAFLCSRSSRIAQCVPHTNAEARHSLYGGPRRPMSYTSSASSRRGSSVVNIPRNTLNSTQNGAILVSPSQPVMIGSEDVEGGFVKIMVTPPTPSRIKPDRRSNSFGAGVEGSVPEDSSNSASSSAS